MPGSRTSVQRMNIKLAPGWLYRAAIVALAVWVLHSFVEALLAACVAAIASWPLYKRFAARLAPRVGSEHDVAAVHAADDRVRAGAADFRVRRAADRDAGDARRHRGGGQGGNQPFPAGFRTCRWSDLGSRARWQHELAHPGALTMWTQRTDPAALLAWAQSLGQFMARHAFIIGLHHPVAVLSVPGRRSAGRTIQARACGMRLASAPRLCRPCERERCAPRSTAC